MSAPPEDLLTRRIGPLFVADLLCAALFALPFLFAPWPIGTDLPQHAAQIHLLGRAVGGDPTLGVHWFAPNTIVYWPLAACIAVFGPVAGTKVLCWALAWGASVLGLRLCAQRGHQPGYAVVAAVFLLNSNLYWGFLPFQFGWIAFVGWLLLLLSPSPNTPLRLVAFGLASLFLLGVHSLWFAAAAVAGLVVLAVRPSAWKQRAARGLAAFPAAALAAWWAPQVRAKRDVIFDVEPRWLIELGDRFGAEFLGAAVFGNIIDDYVPVVGLLVVVALLLLSQTRGTSGFDRELCAIGAVLLVAVFVLPDKYMNTIDFARRWAPYGCALFVMGGLAELLPRWATVADRVPRAATVLAAAPLLVAVVWTTWTWSEFAREELSGFDDAMAEIGSVEHPRVLGVTYLRRSKILYGYPFMQQFAWAQAVHGGALNFSFTEHGTALVYNVDPGRPPWTIGLEWLPHRLKPSDLDHFDVMLVGGPAMRHDRFVRNDQLEPLNRSGDWRAYRIRERW